MEFLHLKKNVLFERSYTVIMQIRRDIIAKKTCGRIAKYRSNDEVGTRNKNQIYNFLLV